MKPNVLFLFLCFALVSCNSHRQVAKPVATSGADSMVRFAEQAWFSAAQKIPAGMEEAFGFKNLEEIEKSSIGEPIRMYYWQGREDGEIITSNTYRFPILVDGKKVSLLTVSTDGEMTSEDFGGAILARNIQDISDAYQVKITGILRIHIINSDFLVFEEKNISYFIPVVPHTLSNLSQKNVLELNDIVTIVRNQNI